MHPHTCRRGGALQDCPHLGIILGPGEKLVCHKLWHTNFSPGPKLTSRCGSCRTPLGRSIRDGNSLLKDCPGPKGRTRARTWSKSQKPYFLTYHSPPKLTHYGQNVAIYRPFSLRIFHGMCWDGDFFFRLGPPCPLGAVLNFK